MLVCLIISQFRYVVSVGRLWQRMQVSARYLQRWWRNMIWIFVLAKRGSTAAIVIQTRFRGHLRRILWQRWKDSVGDEVCALTEGLGNGAQSYRVRLMLVEEDGLAHVVRRRKLDNKFECDGEQLELNVTALFDRTGCLLLSALPSPPVPETSTRINEAGPTLPLQWAVPRAVLNFLVGLHARFTRRAVDVSELVEHIVELVCPLDVALDPLEKADRSSSLVAAAGEEHPPFIDAMHPLLGGQSRDVWQDQETMTRQFSTPELRVFTLIGRGSARQDGLTVYVRAEYGIEFPPDDEAAPVVADVLPVAPEVTVASLKKEVR